ncbi:MAG: hypothetical protein HY737_02785 [Candidatus Omnitrophica bacterium]|nr:hypothetical protein [Candidatus Omnitrophota bacterium]
MAKSALTTIRFTPQEAKELKVYLQRNPAFASISSLGRVATMEFIRSKTSLPLTPVQGGGSQRPWFLWDYNLSEAQVQELLHHAPFAQKKWLIARLLERLRPPEIFQYLSPEQMRAALPHLRMDEKVKRHWQEAVELWTSPARKS